MNPSYSVGLDLGQPHEYTALAILERQVTVEASPAARRQVHYACRHLERFAPWTAYPVIASRVMQLLQFPPKANQEAFPLLGRSTLVVDQTGVGRAVVDLFRQALRSAPLVAQLKAVTITAGNAVASGEDGSVHVPKKELASILQVLLQTRRLSVANTLPHAAKLVQEFLEFKVKITVSANGPLEGWRERAHDDLVMAVALAAWVGERNLLQGGLPFLIPNSPIPWHGNRLGLPYRN